MTCLDCGSSPQRHVSGASLQPRPFVAPRSDERFTPSLLRAELPRPPPDASLRSLRLRLGGVLERLLPSWAPPELLAPRLPALRLFREVLRELPVPDFMSLLLEGYTLTLARPRPPCVRSAKLSL
jgi:hypothetical protein